jgi:hypothetical protein
MKGFLQHKTGASAERAGLDDELAVLDTVLSTADRACCCPARPVVKVVLPAAGSRPEPTDLLLCGHHYRASQAALIAAGASAYDEHGALILGTALNA